MLQKSNCNVGKSEILSTFTRRRLLPVDSQTITLIDLRTRSNSNAAILFDLFIHHSQQPVLQKSDKEDNLLRDHYNVKQLR